MTLVSLLLCSVLPAQQSKGMHRCTAVAVHVKLVPVRMLQVPQFLFAAGYGSPAYPERAGLIGVTQPRRVAAISTAHRVAEELASPVGGAVGYQVSWWD